MRVIGKGRVHLYEPIDECPHAPNDEELWQESWALFFWDVVQKVYVFMRIGQEPNRGDGYTSAWVNVWTPEFIFKHTDDSIAMQAGDRTATAISAGHGLCRYEYDGTHRWSVKTGDVQLQLRVHDHHPSFGYWPGGSAALAGETARHHLEATCQVAGSVTVRGKVLDVSGSGWRDHSWGKRNWRGIRAHRFYAGIFGEDFSFFGITMVTADGSMARIGTIMRGDSVEATSDFKIVSYIGEDGVSNCGGQVRLLLDGTIQTLDFKPLAMSVVSVHQDCTISDAMCDVTMNHRPGIGISESSNNAQGGTQRPAVFPHSRGIRDNGLFPAAADGLPS